MDQTEKIKNAPSLNTDEKGYSSDNKLNATVEELIESIREDIQRTLERNAKEVGRYQR